VGNPGEKQERVKQKRSTREGGESEKECEKAYLGGGVGHRKKKKREEKKNLQLAPEKRQKRMKFSGKSKDLP